MIIATGIAKPIRGDSKDAPRSITWNAGALTGDPYIIALIKTSALINNGQFIKWHGPVDDWLSDPVSFGLILLDVFDESTLNVVVTDNERLAPPPCPDNAVC